jgi:hypothetical protein
MADNLIIVDRDADTASVFVTPGVERVVFPRCPATKSPGTVPENADHVRHFLDGPCL